MADISFNTNRVNLLIADLLLNICEDSNLTHLELNLDIASTQLDSTPSAPNSHPISQVWIPPLMSSDPRPNAPIETLPSELLADIFLWCVERDSSSQWDPATDPQWMLVQVVEICLDASDFRFTQHARCFSALTTLNLAIHPYSLSGYEDIFTNAPLLEELVHGGELSTVVEHSQCSSFFPQRRSQPQPLLNLRTFYPHWGNPRVVPSGSVLNHITAPALQKFTVTTVNALKQADTLVSFVTWTELCLTHLKFRYVEILDEILLQTLSLTPQLIDLALFCTNTEMDLGFAQALTYLPGNKNLVPHVVSLDLGLDFTCGSNALFDMLRSRCALGCLRSVVLRRWPVSPSDLVAFVALRSQELDIRYDLQPTFGNVLELKWFNI
ncbi:hypothetical protein DFH07DRAFT_772729 [Mycena maculata]|uniref:Uncharacterized protein n=1 Tax=Mycena maculata TaxID=230809 RepID=A0AAD7J5X5_9AGAR|nr:hypothetical protein DFH07DRAFT_772729 [Mycena maculata]